MHTSYRQQSYAGIDVSKRTLDLALLQVGGDGPVATRHVPNTPEGHQCIIEMLQGHDIHRIVVEATGGYEQKLTQALQAASLPIAVVNPKRVRDYAKALGHLAKTDAIDATMSCRRRAVSDARCRCRSSSWGVTIGLISRAKRAMTDQHLLEVLANPGHDEHAELLDWLGGGFNAEHFDPAEIVFADPKERLKFVMT